KGGREWGGAPLVRVGGFERGQLAVDNLRDREELDAVEPARDRVPAFFVVDPVKDADAILDGVTESGIADGCCARRNARRLLAHLQRKSLLVGVLVHEKRGRKLF